MLAALLDEGRSDELANRIVEKLGGADGVDAAVVKQAVKDALKEGTE
jgi:hypothetical protein